MLNVYNGSMLYSMFSFTDNIFVCGRVTHFRLLLNSEGPLTDLEWSPFLASSVLRPGESSM